MNEADYAALGFCWTFGLVWALTMLIIAILAGWVRNGKK